MNYIFLFQEALDSDAEQVKRLLEMGAHPFYGSFLLQAAVLKSPIIAANAGEKGGGNRSANESEGVGSNEERGTAKKDARKGEICIALRPDGSWCSPDCVPCLRVMLVVILTLALIPDPLTVVMLALTLLSDPMTVCVKLRSGETRKYSSPFMALARLRTVLTCCAGGDFNLNLALSGDFKLNLALGSSGTM